MVFEVIKVSQSAFYRAPNTKESEEQDVEKAVIITATEGLNILPRKLRSQLKNTDLEKVYPVPVRPATINRLRSFGTLSNVRSLISGISHSRKQAEFQLNILNFTIILIVFILVLDILFLTNVLKNQFFNLSTYLDKFRVSVGLARFVDL